MEQAIHAIPAQPEVKLASPDVIANPVPDIAPAPKQGGGITNFFGAALSVSLLLGLGVWGYKLAVRDVTGIPIVRAIDGPMRIQPDDPGGESAAYQGYSVNAVASEGGVEAPADRLALAPRNSGLEPGDRPVLSQSEMSALSVAEAIAAPTITSDTQAVIQPETGDAAAQMLALVDTLTEGVTPLADSLTDIEPTSSSSTQDAANSAVAAALLSADVIPSSVPGVNRSPRPNPRPAGLAQLRLAAAATSAPAPSTGAQQVREIASANIPAGTRLVQLGAFDSVEVARSEWDRLMGQFGDYLQGKDRVIQEASSGGKTFFRLRAVGFEDYADTQRFCSVLIAGNALCISVMTR